MGGTLPSQHDRTISFVDEETKKLKIYKRKRFSSILYGLEMNYEEIFGDRGTSLFTGYRSLELDGFNPP